MFDLFGAEMPLAVRFFLAFLIVLGLIGAAAWAVRRFGSTAGSAASARGRQPRLARDRLRQRRCDAAASFSCAATMSNTC